MSDFTNAKQVINNKLKELCDLYMEYIDFGIKNDVGKLDYSWTLLYMNIEFDGYKIYDNGDVMLKLKVKNVIQQYTSIEFNTQFIIDNPVKSVSILRELKGLRENINNRYARFNEYYATYVDLDGLAKCIDSIKF